MSERIKRNAPYLLVLKNCKCKQRKAIIGSASNDLVKCLCECCLNILQGSVNVSEANHSKLKRHKTVLRSLASRKGSIKAKRNILIQKGGFLPLLLGALAPAIGGILSKLFN